MTAEVIDQPCRRWLAEFMRANEPGDVTRFDRTLRAVMWMDAFLSVALVVVGVVASPIVATLGVPQRGLYGLGLATMVCATLLAAFGAITAIALMLRLRAGNYLLPSELRLPLPGPMRPPFGTGSGAHERSSDLIARRSSMAA